MAKIHLADNFPLPAEVVTETMAALGRKGSGKTYLAGRLFEQMFAIGAQCLVLDPVGTWYGLRLSASGKRAGLDIPVLGGDHGDVPLEAEAGALIARVVVDRGLSAVIDLSDFRKGRMKKFATDFAEEFFQLKKRSRSPVHLFIEEARTLVPQKMFGDQDPRMVGAFEDIVRRGRNYGIGCTLLDQRPQSVNKEVLSQVEILMAMQTVDKLGRKEIEDWVRQKEVAGAEALNQLATLQPGEAFVWSPALLKTFARVKVGKKETYDTSATPKFGSRGTVAPKPLSSKDLAELRDSMKDMVEQAEAKDTRVLQAKVRAQEMKLGLQEDKINDLEDRLKRATGKTTTKIKTTEVSVLKPGDRSKLVALNERMRKLSDQLSTSCTTILDTLQIKVTPPQPVPNPPGLRTGNGAASPHRTIQAPASRAVPPSEYAIHRPVQGTDSDSSLTGPEQRVLDALAWMEAIGVNEPEVTAVAFLAGYKPGTGAFNNCRGKLRSRGLVQYSSPGSISLTDEGRPLATPPDVPRTTEGLHRVVLAKLGGPERRVLKPLLDAYPTSLNVESLAVAAGYQAGTGAFNNCRGRLRTLGLVIYPERGRVRASDVLFVGS